MNKKIYPHGYFSENSCPKCKGTSFSQPSYYEEDGQEWFIFRCYSCSFSWEEHLDSDATSDSELAEMFSGGLKDGLNDGQVLKEDVASLRSLISTTQKEVASEQGRISKLEKTVSEAVGILKTKEKSISKLESALEHLISAMQEESESQKESISQLERSVSEVVGMLKEMSASVNDRGVTSSDAMQKNEKEEFW